MKKWFAVIGDPIAHSKSPNMHNMWFEAMNIDATYIPIHVKPEQLEQSITSLKTLGASGWNITIPHKQAIIPFLDELDELAEKMGAVNTVVRLPDGKLKGYNTDGPGFVHSLEEKVGKDHKAKKVLLIGAGGAARGIAFALQQFGYNDLTITNRTTQKAEAIISEIGSGQAVSLQEAEQHLNQYGIIIQCTSAGLAQSEFSLPLSLDKLQEGAIVADIVYNPLMTPFLVEAQKNKAIVVNGLGMFVHQGAIAFHHWLGQYPDTNGMTKKLTAELELSTC
ncbi:shikimate dehydrogenase [Lysinibacillus antri]|uniref:Shikimate dehydrogenase (NADP(+)) n=1 Tax=Lysinibacillus antri TaxID=2498145 RepID=A0A3S0RY80_9BACI|nr:shikimate dehydrogenase [Lysinibacillus antri]RUL57075.1 shikimate dehydrogenase [Lysinibacillus antri]